MEHKGWIALDIDGTITLDKYSVPKEVIQYLSSLHSEGWNIAMATGRSFAFASMALSQFDFPYFFLPQNGSVALKMPGKKLLFTKYMEPQKIPKIESAFDGIEGAFVIYAGFNRGDFCYWRPQDMSEEERFYFEGVQKREGEKGRAVENFHPEQFDSFPLVKCFGKTSQMEKVSERLDATGLFHVTKIKDPFSENFYLLLVTDVLASKGLSLQELFRIQGRGKTVIAAGDDMNDIILFEVADVKIAMSHAPESLREIADYIAPPTKEFGIIRALELALRDYGH